MERAVANGGPVAIGFPAPTTALPLGNGPVLTTTLSFLSSRAQPRDLQCHGPFLEMFFSCSMDNEAAKKPMLAALQ
ncbi:MAG: hypothetical protein QOE55_532 [Acidobacteriaceae bacterium]|jgi:hypothetical protein|nr:hypothetical protein [Acidobacteriaceae bacterium]